MNQSKQPSFASSGPPPPYDEQFLSPNSNLPYQPNFVTNSSATPILPNGPPQNPHYSGIPNYGTVIVVNEPVQRAIVTSESTGFVCPVCNAGLLEREFTLLGFLLAILLFPFGLICLFILKRWRCSLCNTTLGY